MISALIYHIAEAEEIDVYFQDYTVLAVDQFSLRAANLMHKHKYTFLPFEYFFDRDAPVGSLRGKRRRFEDVGHDLTIVPFVLVEISTIIKLVPPWRASHFTDPWMVDCLLSTRSHHGQRC